MINLNIIQLITTILSATLLIAHSFKDDICACLASHHGFWGSIGRFLTINGEILGLAFLAIAIYLLWLTNKENLANAAFVIGILSATTILITAFFFENNCLLYGGVSILLGSSVLNFLLKRK